jgi:hypothetical protein
MAERRSGDLNRDDDRREHARRTRKVLIKLGIVVAICFIGLVLSGCGVGGPAAGPYPEACSGFGFKPQQCDAVVDRARASFPRLLDDADIAAINLLPPPPAGRNLGGYPIALVEFVLADGERASTEVWCLGVGSQSDRSCQPDARITLSTGVDGDVPCAGEPPAGCATRPPPPRATSVDASAPMVIASLEVPIDHVGPYEIEIGAASLPDGALSVRTATLADPQPIDYWIDEGIRIEVRPDISGRPPIGSVFRDPFDGPESVHVFLVFDVVEFEPGAVLRLTDIEIR